MILGIFSLLVETGGGHLNGMMNTDWTINGVGTKDTDVIHRYSKWTLQVIRRDTRTVVRQIGPCGGRQHILNLALQVTRMTISSCRLSVLRM